MSGLSEDDYFAVTGLELARLLNFKSTRLDWKRVVRQQQRESDLSGFHD